MSNKKKDLLKEELSKFKLMSEYSFYEDRESLAEVEGEEDGEEIPGAELGPESGEEELPPEEPTDELTPDEPAPEGGEEEGLSFSDDEEGDVEIPDEEPAGDEIELDVTELVQGTEEAKASADMANQNISKLMGMVNNLENQLSSMDKISSKIDSLEHEIEKRVPTEEEKLEMRSLDSYPYNLKLTDFWNNQEGQYDVMGNEKKQQQQDKEYVLTQDDVDNDYDETDIKDSFDFEEEEI